MCGNTFEYGGGFEAGGNIAPYFGESCHFSCPALGFGMQPCRFDRGPGIEDIEKAMEAGYSTASARVREMGFGAGMGLSNMKKNSDFMNITSTPGEGTTVELINYLKPISVPSSIKSVLKHRNSTFSHMKI